MEIRENSVGYCTCPVCGESVDVRVNKNFKLYVICDNSHRLEFSAKDSFKARPLLASGKSAQIGAITIYPLNSKKEEVKNEERTQQKRGSEPKQQSPGRNPSTSGRSEPREQSRGNLAERGRVERTNDDWGIW